MLRKSIGWCALAATFFVVPVHAQICAPFTDVAASNPFCGDIQWMLNRGITSGCGTNLYCPNDVMPREQMAAFMKRLADKVTFQQGGNAFGAAGELGTTDDQALEIIVNNSRVMRYEPNAISPNVIGGSPANNVTAGVRGATIAGGGVPVGGDPNFGGAPNRVTDAYGTVGGGSANVAGDDAGNTTDRRYATVGGGRSNTASGFNSSVAGGIFNTANGTASTVAGGSSNTASGSNSTVAGGNSNTASGDSSTVAGGNSNAASGTHSTVAGGVSNAASGNFSFAAGINAQADQNGCFVFANWSTGGSGSCLGLANVARFLLDRGLDVEYGSRRVDGGGSMWVHIGDIIPGQAIATSTGGFLSTGGQWVNFSDAAHKESFGDIDTSAILDRLVAMPIRSWRYKVEADATRHIGPTAQDFMAAFKLGEDARTIGTIDADGVALAAIQGLNAKVEAQAREIDELKRVVASLHARSPASP